MLHHYNCFPQHSCTNQVINEVQQKRNSFKKSKLHLPVMLLILLLATGLQNVQAQSGICTTPIDFTDRSLIAIGTGNQPHSIVIADFNGDGKPDMATANSNLSSVTVILGDGIGGYISIGDFKVDVGGVPNSIVTSDFNKDGKLDLATANLSSSNISV